MPARSVDGQRYTLTAGTRARWLLFAAESLTTDDRWQVNCRHMLPHGGIGRVLRDGDGRKTRSRRRWR